MECHRHRAAVVRAGRRRAPRCHSVRRRDGRRGRRARLGQPSALSHLHGRAAAGAGSLPRRLFALGLSGSEGRIRGGGELFTLLGLPCQADGYTGAITYAGLDRGDLFAQAGLGLGTYWGGVDLGMATAAGNLHGQIGYRLMPEVIVMTRGDVIVGSTAANALVTIGIQLIPDARPLPRRAARPSPRFEQPASSD